MLKVSRAKWEPEGHPENDEDDYCDHYNCRKHLFSPESGETKERGLSESNHLEVGPVKEAGTSRKGCCLATAVIS